MRGKYVGQNLSRSYDVAGSHQSNPQLEGIVFLLAIDIACGPGKK